MPWQRWRGRLTGTQVWQALAALSAAMALYGAMDMNFQVPQLEVALAQEIERQ